MGIPLISQVSVGLLSNNWEKVSNPRKKPTKQSADRSHFLVSLREIEYFSCFRSVAMNWSADLTTMFITSFPGSSLVQPKTSTRQRLSISSTKTCPGDSITYLISQGEIVKVSAALSIEKLAGLGHRREVVWTVADEATRSSTANTISRMDQQITYFMIRYAKSGAIHLSNFVNCIWFSASTCSLISLSPQLIC